MKHTDTHDVLVGLDSSAASRAALAWAADYARSTHGRLHALHVTGYDTASPMGWPGFEFVGYAMTIESRDAVKSEVTAMFRSVDPEADWLLEFVDGPTGDELVRRSGAVRLLVVGTQEHIGLGRVFAGSVSHYCLTRAKCPVVAVPAPVATNGHAEVIEPPTTAGAASR